MPRHTGIKRPVRRRAVLAAEVATYGQWTRNRACRSKVAYPDDYSAIAGALGASSRFGGAYRWYRCGFCGCYHITSHAAA
jgi:hypothetical protein